MDIVPRPLSKVLSQTSLILSFPSTANGPSTCERTHTRLEDDLGIPHDVYSRFAHADDVCGPSPNPNDASVFRMRGILKQDLTSTPSPCSFSFRIVFLTSACLENVPLSHTVYSLSSFPFIFTQLSLLVLVGRYIDKFKRFQHALRVRLLATGARVFVCYLSACASSASPAFKHFRLRDVIANAINRDSFFFYGCGEEKNLNF